MYASGTYLRKMRINPNDLVGKKFGRLTVISYAGYKDDINKTGRTHIRKRHYYLCQCECGNFTVLRRCTVISESTRSCGCLKEEMYEKRRKENKQK